MPLRLIDGVDDLRTLVGTRLGGSDWYEVTQERINAFAHATGDHQWIHVDPERAKRDSPYGTTIAHGFFTLSLVIALSEQVFRFVGIQSMVNYGLNRVRFPSPVRVGSRIRMHIDVLEVKDAAHGVQATIKETFEIEGETRPACVAEHVLRLFF